MYVTLLRSGYDPLNCYIEKLMSSSTTWTATRPYNQRPHVHRFMSVYAVLLQQIIQRLEKRQMQGDQKMFRVILRSTRKSTTNQ